MSISAKRVAAIAVLGGILAACQTAGAPMSVEDARKVAAGFKGQAFVAPPRTTSDILSLLQELKPSTQTRVKILNADLKLDASTPKDERWKFLRRRAYVRQLAGRMADSLLDWRAAVAESRHVPIRAGRRDVMRSLALTEMELGNFKQAGLVIQQAIAEQDGRSVGSHEVAAQIFHAMGDTDNTVRYAVRTAVLASEEKVRGLDPAQVFREPTIRYLLAEAEGNWLEAETFIRRSIDAYINTDRKTWLPNWVERRQFILARNLIRQERFVEAEAVARQALISLLKKSGQESLDVVRALGVFSEALILEGRNDEAVPIMTEALRLLQEMGVPDSSPYGAEARSILARALAGTANWPGAARVFDAMRASLEPGGFLYNKYYANDPAVAVAYAQAGRKKDALKLADGLIADFADDYGAGGPKAAEMAAIIGIAYARGGDAKAALPHLRQAFDAMVAGRSTSEILRQAVNGYLEALFVADADGRLLNTKSVADAFAAVQLARAGSVRRAVSASSARAAASGPELKQMVRQLQDSEFRLASVEGHLANMLAAPPDQQTDSGVADLSEKISTLRRAITSLKAEIRIRFPRYDQLVNPSPMKLADFRNLLGENQALTAFFSGRDHVVAFAISRGGAVAASLPLRRADLADRVSRLRAAVDPGPLQSLGDIPAFDVALAHELFRTLLEPVKAGWKDAKELLVVADGPLGALPFSMLVTKPGKAADDGDLLFSGYRKVAWLGRDVAVTGLPSVNALKSLSMGKAATQVARRPFVGFGDPYFSAEQAADAGAQQSVQVASRGVSLRAAPQTRAVDSATLAMLPRLPDTRDEILAIAGSLGADPAKDLYLGERASERAAKTANLSDYRVISFATHGLVPGDLNGLDQPALALSSPKVTKETNDGLLTMNEILGLKLNADFAVLSACNTAAADGAGAEAVSGLGRAFFYAGARALLVSNWPVHSGATTDLMSRLFKSLANDNGLNRAEALWRTKLSQIDHGGFEIDGKMAFSYAHPIFWAPFTVVGDGGGGRPAS